MTYEKAVSRDGLSDQRDFKQIANKPFYRANMNYVVHQLTFEQLMAKINHSCKYWADKN